MLPLPGARIWPLVGVTAGSKEGFSTITEEPRRRQERLKVVRTSQAEIRRKKFFLKRRAHSRAASGVFYFLTTGGRPSTTNRMKHVCCCERLINPPTVNHPLFSPFIFYLKNMESTWFSIHSKNCYPTHIAFCSQYPQMQRKPFTSIHRIQCSARVWTLASVYCY